MALGHLVLKAEREEKGRGEGWVLRSPAMGRVVSLAGRGTWLAAGASAGVLRVLRHEMELRLPEGCSGAVTARLADGKRPVVSYGAALLRIGAAVTADGLGPGGPEADERAAAVAASEAEVPAGMLAVRSPTDGVFYRRPGPDAEAYVQEGAAVERGTVLGLVEVMKCFNQIVYGTEDASPDRGTIHRILAADASEVKYGQVLFVVKPD